MLFNSFQYLIFLPVVVALFWCSPHRFRTVLLLAASYLFYMSWMPIYGLLLFLLTAANYFLGLFVDRITNHNQRRLVFIAGVALNLGCLSLFKYTNFLLQSWHDASNWLVNTAHLPPLPGSAIQDLPIILPLGISFFAFEFIHYLTDVFKGDKPMKSPVEFGLFAAFFPSQIAGPIKRYQDFAHQLVAKINFDRDLFQSGIFHICRGMFKKVVLGDNLASIVTTGFAQPQLMGTLDAWVCVLAFSLQIYFDFSGYTDIGRGSAMLMGFRLPENFNLPYFADSLKEFWHRWHISLSTWLRDYLYIPMGGSRSGKWFSLRNLILTMLLGGLWHGAAWHFVFWGAIHGFGLAVNRIWDEMIQGSATLSAASKTVPAKCLGMAMTFLTVSLAWVTFRASTLPEAIGVYQAMFSFSASTTPETTICQLFLDSTLPAGLTLYTLWSAAMHMASRPGAFQWKNLWPQLPLPARAAAICAFALLVIGLAPQKSIPFIYFQF